MRTLKAILLLPVMAIGIPVCLLLIGILFFGATAIDWVRERI
jgi:hypothetical protein